MIRVNAETLRDIPGSAREPGVHVVSSSSEPKTVRKHSSRWLLLDQGTCSCSPSLCCP